MNELVKELIERLEIRKEQLCGLDLGYKLHSGHHLRDIMTTLAVLRNEPEAKALLANMPQKPKEKRKSPVNVPNFICKRRRGL